MVGQTPTRQPSGQIRRQTDQQSVTAELTSVSLPLSRNTAARVDDVDREVAGRVEP